MPRASPGYHARRDDCGVYNSGCGTSRGSGACAADAGQSRPIFHRRAHSCWDGSEHGHTPPNDGGEPRAGAESRAFPAERPARTTRAPMRRATSPMAHRRRMAKPLGQASTTRTSPPVRRSALRRRAASAPRRQRSRAARAGSRRQAGRGRHCARWRARTRSVQGGAPRRRGGARRPPRSRARRAARRAARAGRAGAGTAAADKPRARAGRAQERVAANDESGQIVLGCERGGGDGL